MPLPVPPLRLRPFNRRPIRTDGEFVLYWMIAARRTHANFALQHAAAEAARLGRPLVILAGIEAHVCVMQTAADLSAAGFGVFAVADAMASRAPASHAMALDRMRDNGVAVVNTEMVVFELLGKAGTAEFKALSALVR